MKQPSRIKVFFLAIPEIILLTLWGAYRGFIEGIDNVVQGWKK